MKAFADKRIVSLPKNKILALSKLRDSEFVLNPFPNNKF